MGIRGVWRCGETCVFVTFGEFHVDLLTLTTCYLELALVSVSFTVAATYGTIHLSACFIAFSTWADMLFFDRIFILLLSLAICYTERALVTVSFAVAATYGTINLSACFIAFSTFAIILFCD